METEERESVIPPTAARGRGQSSRCVLSAPEPDPECEHNMIGLYVFKYSTDYPQKVQERSTLTNPHSMCD